MQRIKKKRNDIMNDDNATLEDNYGDDDIPQIDLPQSNNEDDKSKTTKQFTKL